MDERGRTGFVAGGIERALNVLMVSPKIKTPDDLRVNEWRSAVSIAIGYLCGRVAILLLRPAKTWRSLRLAIGERGCADSGASMRPYSTWIKSIKRKVGLSGADRSAEIAPTIQPGIVVGKDFSGTKGAP
jgi:hypothetical protein